MHFLVLGAPLETSFRTNALRDCISSREFLVYDQETGQLSPGPELESMYYQLKDIESYQELRRFIQSRLTEVLTPLYMAKQPPGVGYIAPLDLGFIFALYDRLKNYMIQAHALLDYISDPSVPIRKVDLAESSPFGEEEEEGVKREQVTHEDIEKWRKYSMTRNLLTGDLQEPEGLGDELDAIRAFPGLHASIKAKLGRDPEFGFQLMRDVRSMVLTDGPERAAEYLVSKLTEEVEERAGEQEAE